MPERTPHPTNKQIIESLHQPVDVPVELVVNASPDHKSKVKKAARNQNVEVTQHAIHTDTIVQNAIAMQRAGHEREAELAEAAGTDALTGMSNRTAMLRHMDMLKSDTQALEQTEILFIDLNNFKMINDTLGHHQGDQGLIAASQIFLGQLRKGEKIFRYGGDEFVLFRDTSVEAERRGKDRGSTDRREADDDNRGLVERFSDSMQDASDLFNRMRDDSRDLQLEASFGLATYQPGDTIGSMLERADDNMYTDKVARKEVEALNL